MPSRRRIHGPPGKRESDSPPPLRPSTQRNSDAGLVAMPAPARLSPNVSTGGDEAESLKMPPRLNSNGPLSRIESRGLVSRPNPMAQQNKGSNSPKSKRRPTLPKKATAHQQEETPDNARNPPVPPQSVRIRDGNLVPLQSVSIREEGNILPDERAPPKRLIYPEPSMRPETNQQSSRRPWNIFRNSASDSLTSIEEHFLMLEQVNTEQEHHSARRREIAMEHMSKRNIDSGRDIELSPVVRNVSLPPLPETLTESPMSTESKKKKKKTRQHRPTTSAGDVQLSSRDDFFSAAGGIQDERPNRPEQIFDLPVDYFELSDLCAQAGCLRPNLEYTDDDYVEHDLSWNEVRQWIQIHSQAEVILPYLKVSDDKGQNALHLACLNQPPHDVINHLIQVLDRSNQLEILHARDSDGRTPLHLACANSAPPDTLRELANWSKTKLRAKDKIGLTPLHNALIGPFRKFPDLVDLLASTGASEVPGLTLRVLPIHYACVFGATEETIQVLRDKYPAGLTQFDSEGRTSLHWALLSCKQAPDTAASTVRLLLNFAPGLSNLCHGNTPDPLVYLLSEVINRNKKAYVDKSGFAPARQEAAKQCFLMLLDTKFMLDPHGNFKFDAAVLRELRSVPSWFFPTALSSNKVQDILDRKMKARFPTVVLMMDLYVQMMVMISYKWNVDQSLELRYEINQRDAEETQAPMLRRLISSDAYIPLFDLLPLYIGGTYFVVRELVQVISLFMSKSAQTFFTGWVLHPADWLDLTYIATIFIWGTILNRGLITEIEIFSNAAALCAGILWIKLFAFLRTISFDFSVFVSGVFYVVQRLVPYMICLLFFLAAFTQVFYTLFFADPEYGCPMTNPNTTMLSSEDYTLQLQCEGLVDTLPFCTRWESFLKVFTMFLGEVDEADFGGSTVAIIFFVIFMLLMVILLANVLIAIVTRYYKKVQDDDGILVFYTNRLNFLSEVEAIKKFPQIDVHHGGVEGPLGANARATWEKLADKFFMRSDTDKERLTAMEEREFDYQQGTHYWNFFSDDPSEDGAPRSADVNICRSIGALIVMIMWFFWGLITVGLVWPPQIREWFFSNATRKRSRAEQDQEIEKDRKAEENHVEEEVKKMREEFHDALVENRKRLATQKASIQNMKYEILKETRRLKFRTQEILQAFDRGDEGSSIHS